MVKSINLLLDSRFMTNNKSNRIAININRTLLKTDSLWKIFLT
jgi:hypothetical protein